MSTASILTDISGTWAIDPAHSKMGFVARHAMVTKVRGSFTDFDATVTVTDDDLSTARVAITIQASSIDTRNEQRDAQLRSNEFLAMAEYPQITFASTSVAQAGSNVLRVTGDLTIRGVTRPVTIPFSFGGTAIDPSGNLRAGFEGALTINRKDYGVSWNAALETGGVLVSDKIALEFDISAIKAA